MGALSCPEMIPPTEPIQVPAARCSPVRGSPFVMEALLGDVVIWVKLRQGLGGHEGIQEGGSIGSEGRGLCLILF